MNFDRIWNDDIRNNVIATVIAAIVLGAAGLVIAWWQWKWVREMSRVVVDVLTEPILVPLWLLGLNLAIFVALGAGSVVLWRRARTHADAPDELPADPPRDSMNEYVTDKIFDIRWRWRNAIDPRTGAKCAIHIRASCGKCGHPLAFAGNERDYDSYRSEFAVFSCEHCGAQPKFKVPIDGHAEERVAREISRYIETGEWVKRVDDPQ